ncbi:hypothetical protein JCM10207_001211 [Rhodosporidiobolus poonsookiae]
MFSLAQSTRLGARSPAPKALPSARLFHASPIRAFDPATATPEEKQRRKEAAEQNMKLLGGGAVVAVLGWWWFSSGNSRRPVAGVVAEEKQLTRRGLFSDSPALAAALFSLSY